MFIAKKNEEEMQTVLAHHAVFIDTCTSSTHIGILMRVHEHMIRNQTPSSTKDAKDEYGRRD